MDSSEKRIMQEQRDFNRRQREERNAKIRKLIDEGLNATTIRDRMGLIGTRNGLKDLKRLSGWKPR